MNIGGSSNGRIALFSLAVALAGVLFGFDVAVISGAEQAIQREWQLDPLTHGMVLSAAVWGTVVGGLGGAWPTDRLGRKGALILVAAGYLVASIGSAFAGGAGSFVLFRFIGGLAIGLSSIAAPAYISEIAPAPHRGRLVGLYQFNIVAGILVAYLSNWLIGILSDAGQWRMMLGIQAVPSLIFLAAVLTVPDSPMWTKAWTRIGLHPDRQPAWRDFLRPPLRHPAGLAVTIAIFNQLSGINAVIYFAPRIFAETGLEIQSALLASVGAGIVNLLATAAAVLLIDRMGRRSLMLIGSAGYCLSLGGLTVAFLLGAPGPVAPLVFLFIAAHAIGQGAVIWVFLAEIFPTEARARGQALGSGTHWLLAALVTMALPPAMAAVPPAAIFGFFLAMMIGQFVWVVRKMPETRGRVLTGELRSTADA